VYVELNDGESALRSADSALALATQGAADELPFALQARARALALRGSPEAALREIDTAIRLFADGGRKPDSFEVLRAQRFRAQFLLMSHADDHALMALRDLAARHEAAPVSAVEKGLMLALLHEAESRAGDTAMALHGRVK
jgi:hypothetical protein